MCAIVAVTGCVDQNARTVRPVSPPLYLQIGKKTSPLFGPGGFTQARQDNSKLPRSGQPKSESPKSDSPKSGSTASESPGP